MSRRRYVGLAGSLPGHEQLDLPDPVLLWRPAIAVAMDGPLGGDLVPCGADLGLDLCLYGGRSLSSVLRGRRYTTPTDVTSEAPLSLREWSDPKSTYGDPIASISYWGDWKHGSPWLASTQRLKSLRCRASTNL